VRQVYDFPRRALESTAGSPEREQGEQTSHYQTHHQTFHDQTTPHQTYHPLTTCQAMPITAQEILHTTYSQRLMFINFFFQCAE
jgi:hypothetical protein